MKGLTCLLLLSSLLPDISARATGKEYIDYSELTGIIRVVLKTSLLIEYSNDYYLDTVQSNYASSTVQVQYQQFNENVV